MPGTENNLISFPRVSVPASLDGPALAFLRRRQPERCMVFADWEELEPEEDRFDEDAFRRLREALMTAGSLGAEPVLCLYRGADPAWFAAKGGWLREDNLRCYLRYAGRTVRTVGHLAAEYVTFFEPNAQVWQEEGESLFPGVRKLSHMACAHIRAVRLIRDTRTQRQLDETKIGFVLRMETPGALRRAVMLRRLPGGGLYQKLPLLAMAGGRFLPPMRNTLRVQEGAWADFVGVACGQDAAKRDDCCRRVRQLTGAEPWIMEE